MADLIELWAQRDAAKAAWAAFMEEADACPNEADPVLTVLRIPVQDRTTEQHELFTAYVERHDTLLRAVYEAERKVRVATGHEKP